MIDVLRNMFTRKDPKLNATLALARIISSYDMERLPYEVGIKEDRRSRTERAVAFGVWLFPWSSDHHAVDFEPQSGAPAVTHDLRAEGFGIMTPVQLTGDEFLVAAPCDDNSSWRFFRCGVRHNTPKPGGWFQLGLQVISVVALDGDQQAEFRDHVAAVHAESRLTVS